MISELISVNGMKTDQNIKIHCFLQHRGTKSFYKNKYFTKITGTTLLPSDSWIIKLTHKVKL